MKLLSLAVGSLM